MGLKTEKVTDSFDLLQFDFLFNYKLSLEGFFLSLNHEHKNCQPNPSKGGLTLCFITCLLFQSNHNFWQFHMLLLPLRVLRLVTS